MPLFISSFLASFGSLFLVVAALGQEPPSRIALSADHNTMSLHFSQGEETNSWTIESSENLHEWAAIAEILELNGRGEFTDPEHHSRRYYRVLRHGNNVQAAIDRSRRKWQQSGITDYEFTFQWICFCLPDYVEPVVITVHAGQITHVRTVQDGTALDPADFGRYRTIDGLFDLLQQALGYPAHRVSARFDPRLGYPLRAFVDYIEFAVDDELSFTVRDLRPLTPPPAVQITDTTPSELQQDRFTFEGKDAVSIDGNTLTLRVQYGGGCEEHDFDLFMSPGVFLESFPVQANLYLRHNAHGDLCRALITREITFDLSPIANLYHSQYGRTDPIILNVFPYEESEPADPISVTYTP